MSTYRLRNSKFNALSIGDSIYVKSDLLMFSINLYFIPQLMVHSKLP